MLKTEPVYFPIEVAKFSIPLKKELIVVLIFVNIEPIKGRNFVRASTTRKIIITNVKIRQAL